MPLKPKVLYGFEHETIEAKIRSFLTLTPAERIKTMMEFMEFTAAIERATAKKNAKKLSQPLQRAKRRSH